MNLSEFICHVKNFIEQLTIKLDLTNIMFWYVSLHEKNHFVPGSGGLFGSTFVLSNAIIFDFGNPDKKMITSNYDIQPSNATYLNEEGSRCSESTDFEISNYNLCYEKYIEAAMNCSLPWGKQNDSRHPDCHTFAQKEFLSNATYRIEAMGEREVYKATGCSPSCTRREFTTTKLMDTEQNITYWSNRSIAKVVFYYSSSKYKTKEQYLVFTAGDFIANVGGYLGLLLGHSAISLYDGIKTFCTKSLLRKSH